MSPADSPPVAPGGPGETDQRPANSSPERLVALFGPSDRELENQERRPGRRPTLDEIFENDQSDPIARPFDAGLFSRLMGYVRPYGRPMVISLVLMAVASAAAVAVPNLVGSAIDAVSSGLGPGADRVAALGRLRLFVLLVVGMTVVEWVTNRARLFIMADVGTRIVVQIRGDMFEHMQQLSLRFYDQYKVGRLMSRIMGDVSVLRDFVTWSLVGTARSVTTLVFILITLLLRDWKLASLVLLVLPVMGFLTRVWSARAREAWREVRRRIAIINGYLNETVSGVRVIQSFTRESANERTFNDLNRRHFDANLHAARMSAVFFPTVDILGTVAVAIVVVYGALVPNTLSAGDLVAFVALVDRFFDPIRELSRRYNQLLASMAASERIFELLDLVPDVRDTADAYTLPPIQGDVRYQGVWFAYEEEPVLKDINLDIPQGATVALVGETGAGKTSMINLLARFYDVHRGSISVDGHDISGVTLDSLRSQLGVVLQETYLFSGSVADNIRYGRPEATDDEVIESARAVGADEFIRSLGDAYATEVGERGMNLSVGQRQLVSFARALLADPRILILDEATSSIDTESERVIQTALRRLLQGRTAVVIAHRLSTITSADLIVVMHNGAIVERGTHDELLAAEGVYFNLYTMQWTASGDGA
jgi:ATP-binding cassette, subfamily B, multidrug efflux pump